MYKHPRHGSLPILDRATSNGGFYQAYAKELVKQIQRDIASTGGSGGPAGAGAVLSRTASLSSGVGHVQWLEQVKCRGNILLQLADSSPWSHRCIFQRSYIAITARLCCYDRPSPSARASERRLSQRRGRPDSSKAQELLHHKPLLHMLEDQDIFR